MNHFSYLKRRKAQHDLCLLEGRPVSVQVLRVSLNWLQSYLEENIETFSMWKCFRWFHTASGAMENCADNRLLASKENVVQNFYSALNSVLFECCVVVP